jgi:capsule polysaccharide export protein KpsC/LpsZ
VHELVKYNNSQDYSIEILPNKEYRVFDDTDTLADGSWELHVSDDTSTVLMLNGDILGVDEYRVE